MFIKFTKMQGTGNDFIMLDQFASEQIELSKEQIRFLCDRKFGIGADGLIILRDSETSEFEMIYYNADGLLSTMCGNGGRCIVKLAYDNRYIDENTYFHAPDGTHKASIESDIISLHMKDVDTVTSVNDCYILNSGSPHYVKFVNDLDFLDVHFEGAKIRNSEAFKKDGINVNFIEILNDNEFKVRTYERGVEAETLSCGTGVTAAAIAAHVKTGRLTNKWNIITKGGPLKVEFNANGDNFSKIILIGLAETVFEGKISLID